MTQAARPLSPHLQVYRWQLTSVLSILHRATGTALSAGTIVLVLWLIGGAAAPDLYAGVQWFIGSWLGLVLLFGWTASLFYHLCNGIRHLWWDTGKGLELSAVYASGWSVLAATAVLTVLAWGFGIAQWGP